MAEFNAIDIEFPTKAPVSFAKVNGYWHLTAPYKARADQPSVQRILGIIAAKTTSRIQSNDLEKYGLQALQLWT